MSVLFQISQYNGVYGRIPFGGAVERDEALKMLATLLSPAPLPEPQQGPRGEMYGPYALTPVKEDDFLFLVMLSDYDNDRIVSGLHASQKDAYRAMLRHAADCGLDARAAMQPLPLLDNPQASYRTYEFGDDDDPRFSIHALPKP